jgi:hypothetical protein
VASPPLPYLIPPQYIFPRWSLVGPDLHWQRPSDVSALRADCVISPSFTILLIIFEWNAHVKGCVWMGWMVCSCPPSCITCSQCHCDPTCYTNLRRCQANLPSAPLLLDRQGPAWPNNPINSGLPLAQIPTPCHIAPAVLERDNHPSTRARQETEDGCRCLCATLGLQYRASCAREQDS